MKAFLLLVILFLGFIFIAATGISGIDLTPDTPAVSAASISSAEDTVIHIEDAPAVSDSGSGVAYAVPVTGTCSDPYTVRAGDMLSSIAVNCGTTMAAIRQLNPEIRNANLIYPGQLLRIPSGGASVAAAIDPTPVPVTGEQPAPVVITVDTPEVAVTVNPPLQQQPDAVAAAPSNIPAIRPGTGMQVKGLNYPPNTPVHIAIGPLDTGYNVIGNGLTDSQGNITATIIVPTAQDPNTEWVVVVATINDPIIQAASHPFTIRP